MKSFPKKTLASHKLWLGGLAAILALLWFRTPLIYGQDSDFVTLDKEVEPDTTFVGYAVTVTLVINGSDAQCDPSIVRRALDVALVMDRSVSMNSVASNMHTDTKLEAAKQAAQAFVNQLDLTTDQVTVIQFNHTTQLLQPLTNNKPDILRHIQSLSPEGQTDIHLALARAHRELLSARHNSNAIPILIILSDGQSQSDEFLAKQAARNARDDGIQVIAIGLGRDVDKILMRQVASSSSDYHDSPDSAALRDIYLSIAEQILSFIGITDLEISHGFDPSVIEPLPDTITGGGQLLTTNAIVWKLSNLEGAYKFSYQARVESYGSLVIDTGDQLTYLHCESERRTLSYPPTLNVTAPTLTPTAPPTLTPTPTSSPTSTPTPTLTPTPTPTPTLTSVSLVYWPTQGDFPCLPFIILLPMLLGLFLLFRRRGDSATKYAGKPTGYSARVREPSKRHTETTKKRGKDVTHGQDSPRKQ